MFIPALGLGFFIFFPLIWIVVAILLCVWVYKDAKARGEEAVLWLILVLITNIIGVIIWLIVRPEKKSEKRRPSGKSQYCSNCGAEIDPESKFCSECGKEIG